MWNTGDEDWRGVELSLVANELQLCATQGSNLGITGRVKGRGFLLLTRAGLAVGSRCWLWSYARCFPRLFERSGRAAAREPPNYLPEAGNAQLRRIRG